MKVPDLFVGKRLFVGIGKPEALGRGKDEIRGSAFLEGPVQMGTADAFDSVEATTMIGRDKNTDGSEPDRSLHVKGNQMIEGDDGTSSTLTITSSAGRALDINNGTVWIDDQGEAYFQIGTSRMTLSRRFAVADALGKAFDMPHPTKGEGHRLSHACIEGPEIGVYYRGRVRNENTIELPSYWKGLVHEDSISVQLQPIGTHQDIIVEKWDEDKVYLSSKDGMPIDCFYHIYAERKDVNPLHVEYEGDSCFDYPDPNHLNKNPYDQERDLLDPKYKGPRNTITK